MKKAGFTVFTASHGEAVLEFLKQGRRPVDLVLTDVLMPGLPLQELIHRIQRLPTIPKIVVLTGQSPHNPALSHLLETFDLQVIKEPFRTPDVVRKIREVLSV